ncbi:MAG TPA: hypothetical protein VF454_02480 [Gemmatimonadales bacterium]
MTDESKDEPVLDTRLMDAARAHHEPPPVPTEEIWARIQGTRRRKAETPQWKRPQVWVPVAIAATLILGIALGRLWIPIGAGVKGNVAGVPTDSASKAKKEDLFARYAAEQTLGQAEVLLTQYRSDAAAGAATTTTPDEARKLLLATRLLLDAPTLSDPRLRDLLEDLELVLAQIAEGSQVKEDRAVITDGLDRHDVLPRLRAATVNTGIQLPGAI